MLDVRRREFITLLGGAAVAQPLARDARMPAHGRQQDGRSSFGSYIFIRSLEQ
jgi:hypothetical protein